jgi:hypothetical protein
MTSRNQGRFRCFEAVKQLLVIRLNLGDQHRQPRLIKVFIKSVETIIRRAVYYLGWSKST